MHSLFPIFSLLIFFQELCKISKKLKITLFTFTLLLMLFFKFINFFKSSASTECFTFIIIFERKFIRNSFSFFSSLSISFIKKYTFSISQKRIRCDNNSILLLYFIVKSRLFFITSSPVV